MTIDNDIPILKGQNRSLHKCEERYRTLLHAAMDGHWLLDMQGRLLEVNAAYCRMSGYSEEELLSMHVLDLDINENVEDMTAHIQWIIRQGEDRFETKHRRKDGGIYDVEVSVQYRPDDGGYFVGFLRDITDRKRAEENATKLNDILETSTEWIWEIDLSGRHVYSNDTLRDLLGYSPEEFADRDLTDLLHADDLVEVTRKLPLHIEEKRGWRGWLLRWRHKDGTYRWLESNAKPLVDVSGQVTGFRGADRDVTERKRTEEMLRESEGRFRNIAEMLPEVVFELDLSGNISFSNRKSYEMFGYSDEDFVRGLNALEMVIPEERNLASERIRQRLTGEVVGAAEYTALRKDGSTFPVILSATPIIKGLEPVGILGIMTDISERKLNEMALLTATQAADAAKQAKDLFLAKVSHEIRTPLTTIIGFGELLEDADLTPEHKEYLAAINTSGSALSSLVDDVLDLSKANAGELAVKPREFSIHNLIAHLALTHEQQIASMNLSFNISNDNDVPDLLIGDPQRIQQVLLNLLRNAIKFTEKGDIGIAVSVVEENNLRVLLDIAVKDTGIGISADLYGQIFEPFAQVHGSSPHKYGGSGLGLTISRTLAGLMGGSIRVESREGVGSTFHLLIPLQRKIDKLSDKHLPERESLPWSGSTLNVLLAEDNPVNSHFIKTVLEKMGHVVVAVENGKVAIDTLKSNNFDLLLMDIQMPVMNGVDALSVIREREKLSGKHLAVVALTAYALLGDKEKYLNMGFDGYLGKPLKTKELVDELVRVVPS